MHFRPSARLCRAVFSGFRLRKQHKPFNLHTFRPGTHAALARSPTPAQIAPTRRIFLPMVTTATPSTKTAHGATQRLTGANAGGTFSSPCVCCTYPARIPPVSPASGRLSRFFSVYPAPPAFPFFCRCHHSNAFYALPLSSLCLSAFLCLFGRDGLAFSSLAIRSSRYSLVA